MRQTLGEKRVRFSSCSGCLTLRAKARPGLVGWHGSPAASMIPGRGRWLPVKAMWRKTGGQERAVLLPLQGCDDTSKCRSPEGSPASSPSAVGE